MEKWINRLIMWGNIVSYMLAMLIYLLFYFIFLTGLIAAAIALIMGGGAGLLHLMGDGGSGRFAFGTWLMMAAGSVLLLATVFLGLLAAQFLQVLLFQFYKQPLRSDMVLEPGPVADMLQETALKSGISRFSRIYLHQQPDLFTSIEFFNRKTLYAGILLLRLMPVQQLQALAGHECAHHKNAQFGFNLLQFYFYNVYRSFSDWFEEIAERLTGSSSQLIKPLFAMLRLLVRITAFFHGLFYRLVLFFEKRNRSNNYEFEFFCDRASARLHGSAGMAAALNSLADIQVARHLEPESFASFNSLDQLRNHLQQHPGYETSRAALMNASTHKYPSLNERMEQLALLNIPGPPAAMQYLPQPVSRDLKEKKRKFSPAWIYLPLAIVSVTVMAVNMHTEFRQRTNREKTTEAAKIKDDQLQTWALYYERQAPVFENGQYFVYRNRQYKMLKEIRSYLTLMAASRYGKTEFKLYGFNLWQEQQAFLTTDTLMMDYLTGNNKKDSLYEAMRQWFAKYRLPFQQYKIPRFGFSGTYRHDSLRIYKDRAHLFTPGGQPVQELAELPEDK